MRSVAASAALGIYVAYLTACGLQWLSISSGRAPLHTLFLPDLGQEPQLLAEGFVGFWTSGILAAGIAGGLLAPLLWRAIARLRARVLPLSMLAGVIYVTASLLLGVALWLPYTAVSGRQAGRSAVAAGLEGLLLAVVGTPMLGTALVLVFSPVVLIGGAIAGVAVALTMRRRMAP